MFQKSLPSQDIEEDGWTPAPLYSRLKEPTPDDTTFVTSPSKPSGDGFEVKLAALAWPDNGPQQLSVRFRKTSGDDVDVTIALLQGTAVIAVRDVVPSQSFATVVIELSENEKANIT